MELYNAQWERSKQVQTANIMPRMDTKSMLESNEGPITILLLQESHAVCGLRQRSLVV